MIRAKVITTWIKDKEGFTPDAVKFLQKGDSLMDCTGEPDVNRHEVNLVVVEMWISKDTLKAIEKEYGDDAVLEYEPYDLEIDKNEGKKDKITKAKQQAKLTAMLGKSVTFTGDIREFIKARPADKKVKK